LKIDDSCLAKLKGAEIPADEILGQGPRINVQVLIEALINCRRKAGFSCEDTGAFLAGIQSLCLVADLVIQTHQVGPASAEKYQFSVYDALIMSAALIAGCTTLWSEDMNDGLLVEEQLRIVNLYSWLQNGRQPRNRSVGWKNCKVVIIARASANPTSPPVQAAFSPKTAASWRVHVVCVRASPLAGHISPEA